MPRTYDPEYHKRYAQSERGRAARQRARERWLAKRKAESERPSLNPQPLAQVIAQHWRQQ